MGTNRGRANTIAKLAATLPPSNTVEIINSMLGLLRQQGVTVHDWEHKDRVMVRLQRVGPRVYFMAVPDGPKKKPEAKQDGDTKEP